jgi:hypothetical protein
MYLPLKRYVNFAEEMNVFALPGIVLRFVGCLARILVTVPI